MSTYRQQGIGLHECASYPGKQEMVITKQGQVGEREKEVKEIGNKTQREVVIQDKITEKSNEYEEESKSESRHTNVEVNIIITHVNVSGHIKIAVHSDLYLLVWYHAGSFSSKQSTQGKKGRERKRKREREKERERERERESCMKRSEGTR